MGNRAQQKHLKRQSFGRAPDILLFLRVVDAVLQTECVSFLCHLPVVWFGE